MSHKYHKVLHSMEFIEISSLTTPEFPSDFWVMCKDDVEQYLELTQSLQNYCRLNLSNMNQVSGVKAGDLCVVKDENNSWLRAQVEYTDSYDVYLRDVDAGTLLTLQFPHNLYDLPSKYQTGFLGIRCRLNGVLPKESYFNWPTWAIQNFSDNFKPRKMKVKRVEANIHYVDIFVADNKDLASIMVEAQVADRSTDASDCISRILPTSYLLNERSLRKGDVIVVTAITSLTDFYVMRIDEEDKKKLRQLSKDLTSYCNKTDAIKTLSSNLPVACLFSNLWSRALVLNVIGDSAEVFFVDFGKKMNVAKKDIKTIPDDLIKSLPAQSVHCSLDIPDYLCTGSCEEWFRSHCSDSTFIVFDSRKKGNKFLIDVKTKGGSDTVGQQLLQIGGEKHESKTQMAEKKVQSKPEITDEKKDPKPQMADRRIESKRRMPSEPWHNNLIPTSQKIEDGCLAAVVYASSPSDFYVQKVDKETDLMHKDLDNCLRENQLYHCPSTDFGMTVAAKHLGIWRRAVVNEPLPNGFARVLFVDFGNEEVVDKKSIRLCMNPVFKSTPHLAHQCHLNGWSNKKSSKFADKFNELCLEKTFLLKNVRLIAPGSYYVDLIDPDSWQLAFDIDDTSAANGQSECRRPAPDKKSATSTALPVLSQVSIKYFTSPLEFYLSEDSTALANITEQLSEWSGTPVSNPSVGDIVGALFEGIWCRAKIIKLITENLFRVKYIDFGNIDEVELKDLKSISKELQDSDPKAVLCCQLSGAKKDSAKGRWSEEVLLNLKERCEWKSYKLASIKEAGKDEDGETTYEVELIFAEDGLSMAKACGLSTTFRNHLGLVKEGQHYKCVLVNSDSPSNFWCRCLDPAFGDIDGKSITFFDDEEYRPQLGEICLAYDRVEKKWRRVEVKSINSDGICADLIDFGETLNFPLNHLRMLPDDMMFPPMAMHCSLYEAQPIGSKWMPEARLEFVLLLSRAFKVLLVKREGPLHLVKVTVRDTISVLERLRLERYAK